MCTSSVRIQIFTFAPSFLTQKYVIHIVQLMHMRRTSPGKIFQFLSCVVNYDGLKKFSTFTTPDKFSIIRNNWTISHKQPRKLISTTKRKLQSKITHDNMGAKMKQCDMAWCGERLRSIRILLTYMQYLIERILFLRDNSIPSTNGKFFIFFFHLC